MKNQFLIYLYFLFAFLYVILIPWFPYTGASFIKTLPVIILAILVYLQGRPKNKKLLILALIFSGCGDFLLSRYEDGVQKYFIFGLLAFLIAHILYIITFKSDLEKSNRGIIISVCTVIVGIGMSTFLWPRLGELQIPVMVYIGVILLMTVSSSFHSFGGWVLVLGALLFMASDSMIAFNTFVFKEPSIYATFFIMINYYLAQILIIYPFLQKRESKE